MYRTKQKRIQKQVENVTYTHYSYIQHPILPPIFTSAATYSRLVRSPTPSSRVEDSLIERSSINTLITMFSGFETPQSLATTETVSDDEQATNCSEGYSLDRFVEEIDDFFKCPFCRKIVKKPQECVFCQNLMCKRCVSSVFKCPYGCEALQVNQPSKFALISYLKLKIKCCYAEKGCGYLGKIKDIAEHERDCEFSEVKCVNPVCDVMIIRKNMPENGVAVCSEICNMVVGFKRILDTGEPEGLLDEFLKILKNAKENIQIELQIDLEDVIGEAQKKKQEVEEFLKCKELLYQDIEEWRTYYHSGKWNQVVKWWTCCETKEKYSKGCTLIS